MLLYVSWVLLFVLLLIRNIFQSQTMRCIQNETFLIMLPKSTWSLWYEQLYTPPLVMHSHVHTTMVGHSTVWSTPCTAIDIARYRKWPTVLYQYTITVLWITWDAQILIFRSIINWIYNEQNHERSEFIYTLVVKYWNIHDCEIKW